MLREQGKVSKPPMALAEVAEREPDNDEVWRYGAVAGLCQPLRRSGQRRLVLPWRSTAMMRNQARR